MSTLHNLYYKNGSLLAQEFHEESSLHREDGPAYISYHPNGQISMQQWVINDEYHRVDGPAILNYDITGEVVNEVYCLNDQYIEAYSDEEFKRIVKLLALK